MKLFQKDNNKSSQNVQCCVPTICRCIHSFLLLMTNWLKCKHCFIKWSTDIVAFVSTVHSFETRGHLPPEATSGHLHPLHYSGKRVKISNLNRGRRPLAPSILLLQFCFLIDRELVGWKMLFEWRILWGLSTRWPLNEHCRTLVVAFCSTGSWSILLIHWRGRGLSHSPSYRIPLVGCSQQLNNIANRNARQYIISLFGSASRKYSWCSTSSFVVIL